MANACLWRGRDPRKRRVRQTDTPFTLVDGASSGLKTCGRFGVWGKMSQIDRLLMIIFVACPWRSCAVHKLYTYDILYFINVPPVVAHERRCPDLMMQDVGVMLSFVNCCRVSHLQDLARAQAYQECTTTTALIAAVIDHHHRPRDCVALLDLGYVVPAFQNELPT